MYARYFTFKSTPENRSAIEKMADDIYDHTKSLAGFVSATYLISEDQTHYGSFTVWQSREQAEAAAESIRELVMPTIQKLATAAPEVAIMEVYEPK